LVIQSSRCPEVILIAFHVPGLSGDKFKFDANGDGPARYNIIHFKEMSPGSYEWVRVGEYVEGELRLNLSGKFGPYFVEITDGMPQGLKSASLVSLVGSAENEN
jgi:hypothetical protein